MLHLDFFFHASKCPVQVHTIKRDPRRELREEQKEKKTEGKRRMCILTCGELRHCKPEAQHVNKQQADSNSWNVVIRSQMQPTLQTLSVHEASHAVLQLCP